MKLIQAKKLIGKGLFELKENTGLLRSFELSTQDLTKPKR